MGTLVLAGCDGVGVAVEGGAAGGATEVARGGVGVGSAAFALVVDWVFGQTFQRVSQHNDWDYHSDVHMLKGIGQPNVSGSSPFLNCLRNGGKGYEL